MGMQEKGQKLGDYTPSFARFPNVQKTLESLKKDSIEFSEKDRLDTVHRLLLSWIQEAKTPCFLLPAVSDFIQQVREQKLVEGYTFTQFEFWLSHFSSLTAEENYELRAKIMGRYIPREGYQSLFPIGMGKTYPGSHYVTAHSSPDLDTTVASFWGWVDAFAARVSSGLHMWNVPGGPPQSQVEIDFLFYQVFGKEFFSSFAKTRTALALSALDLVSQKPLVEKKTTDFTGSLEEESLASPMILVDESGYYMGDWREEDKEETRKVVLLLQHLMRWFAHSFQRTFIKILSRKQVSRQELEQGLHALWNTSFDEAEPTKEFAEKQKKRLAVYLTKVLLLSEGSKTSFASFWQKMEGLSLEGFASFAKKIRVLTTSDLFDHQGMLVEDRTILFHHVEEIATDLEQAIQSLRVYTQRLDVAFGIKKEVLQAPCQEISHRAEVEEILERIGSLPYLTVTASCGGDKQYPMGIVHAADVVKPILGTVSLRDFCNREETKIPSYLEVISVVDHHKSALQTTAAPMAVIADAQSANALVAELSFSIQDKYSQTGAFEGSLEELLSRSISTPSDYRVLQRALHKKSLIQQNSSYYVDPSREYLEYLHYLYAILDDTDLLSKVSYRDVLTVASLLNRMKTLVAGKETEIISLDDLPLDGKFPKKAAQKILQNDDMYSLYKKIYTLKEESVEESLQKCVRRESSTLFADTKVQNGCSRVGQSKLFAKNFTTYLKHRADICALWYEEAKNYFEESKDCDLHMHMISTIPSADDVYLGEIKEYSHKDELWIWIPQTEQAIGHLKSFLGSFSHSPQIASSDMEVECFGGADKFFSQIFTESFKAFSKGTSLDKKISAPVAIIRYRAGLLNSRKAMVSPYLPKLIK